ncbi:hypothetical protein HRG_014101 [Hirsutella rhossiliensis]
MASSTRTLPRIGSALPGSPGPSRKSHGNRQIWGLGAISVCEHFTSCIRPWLCAPPQWPLAATLAAHALFSPSLAFSPSPYPFPRASGSRLLSQWPLSRPLPPIEKIMNHPSLSTPDQETMRQDQRCYQVTRETRHGWAGPFQHGDRSCSDEAPSPQTCHMWQQHAGVEAALPRGLLLCNLFGRFNPVPGRLHLSRGQAHGKSKFSPTWPFSGSGASLLRTAGARHTLHSRCLLMSWYDSRETARLAQRSWPLNPPVATATNLMRCLIVVPAEAYEPASLEENLLSTRSSMLKESYGMRARQYTTGKKWERARCCSSSDAAVVQRDMSQGAAVVTRLQFERRQRITQAARPIQLALKPHVTRLLGPAAAEHMSRQARRMPYDHIPTREARHLRASARGPGVMYFLRLAKGHGATGSSGINLGDLRTASEVLTGRGAPNRSRDEACNANMCPLVGIDRIPMLTLASHTAAVIRRNFSREVEKRCTSATPSTSVDSPVSLRIEAIALPVRGDSLLVEGRWPARINTAGLCKTITWRKDEEAGVLDVSQASLRSRLPLAQGPGAHGAARRRVLEAGQGPRSRPDACIPYRFPRLDGIPPPRLPSHRMRNDWGVCSNLVCMLCLPSLAGLLQSRRPKELAFSCTLSWSRAPGEGNTDKCRGILVDGGNGRIDGSLLSPARIRHQVCLSACSCVVHVQWIAHGAMDIGTLWGAKSRCLQAPVRRYDIPLGEREEDAVKAKTRGVGWQLSVLQRLESVDVMAISLRCRRLQQAAYRIMRSKYACLDGNLPALLVCLPYNKAKKPSPRRCPAFVHHRRRPHPTDDVTCPDVPSCVSSAPDRPRARWSVLAVYGIRGATGCPNAPSHRCSFEDFLHLGHCQQQ